MRGARIVLQGARIFLHKMRGARIFLQSDLKNHWLFNNHPDPLEYFWEPLEFILGKTVWKLCSFSHCVVAIIKICWVRPNNHLYSDCEQIIWGEHFLVHENIISIHHGESIFSLKISTNWIVFHKWWIFKQKTGCEKWFATHFGRTRI